MVVSIVLIATILPVGLLRFFPPPTTAFMLGSVQRDPATGRPCERIGYRWTPSSRIARVLPRAMVVAEDQRFFAHRGFDTKSIGAALEDYADGAPMRGASTITQQTAKNLFLWPGRSLTRKAFEAWFTIWIELLWPKQRVLEVYVNIAQFGPCLFGAEAASRHYFGVSASDLDAREAALLAAVLPSPGKMSPSAPGPYTERRAQEINQEMLRGGGPTYLRGL
ncbi:MAG: monofunctional biosynthetic peptidoglycan transglycosylase [Myxococcota bacterium]